MPIPVNEAEKAQTQNFSSPSTDASATGEDAPTRKEPQAQKSPRRPRRTKADIEKAILTAATSLICEKGFANTLVTDIVRRAEIEPIVFYNRYRNLDDFYAEFVKNYEDWWPRLIENLKVDITTPDGIEKYHIALLDQLCKDSVMLELVRWEISEGNPLTEQTMQHRQKSLEGFYNMVRDTFDGCPIDLFPLVILVGAGLVFLALIKDRGKCAGLDLTSNEDRELVRKAVHAFSEIIFAFKRHNELFSQEKVPQIPMVVIADRLRREGLSEEVIARVTEF